ncbi:phosphatidylethanolamine-binding protein [Coprinopsis sp. MPI-PUGE-AT-0042]|nr:phosphatidylethanolamine-binding protein [Coprinopsis sp. MPI-PUGE-AT-0042]
MSPLAAPASPTPSSPPSLSHSALSSSLLLSAKSASTSTSLSFFPNISGSTSLYPAMFRPDISLSKPKAWNTPLAPGVIPAYDLALEVLKKDCEGLKVEIAELKKKIEERERAEGGENGEAYTVDLELEKMRQRLHILEVQSEVNLPDVRWKVANAMGLLVADMSVPSHRHLVEQKWRKDGDLDLLVYGTYIPNESRPDVLPSIRPSLDLLVTPPVTKSGQLAFALQNIEPGVYLVPKQTKKPPRLFANVFHTDTRLYIAPYVPDESTASYTTYLHWMQPNIPLSATHTSQILDLDQHTKYLPPHPQKGTPYHRYTVLLLPQPPLQSNTHSYTRNIEARAEPGVPTSQHLDIPVVPDNERLGFNVREFCKAWGLDAKKGGGVHMFREVWDEDVSKIYSDVLGQEEPRYGRQPKYDHYEELKYKKKYIA